MPGVCVCSCGFNTDGGNLCPDWKAFGLKSGVTSVSGQSGGVSTAVTDGWTLVQFARLQYCNDTCHDQVLDVTALCPYVNFNQDGTGNYYDFAVYATAQLDTPPDSSSFALNFSGRVRKNGVSSNLERISFGDVRSAPQLFLLPAGRCLHMVGSTWRNVYQNNGSGQNEISYNRVELNYRAYPQGAENI